MDRFDPRSSNTDPGGRFDTRPSRNNLDRSTSRRFPGNVRREETEAELVRQRVDEETPAFERMAKLAVVAGGVYAAGRFIGKRNLVGVMDWVAGAGRELNRTTFRPVKNFVDNIVLSGTVGRPAIRNSTRASSDLAIELLQMYAKYDGIGQDAIQWLHGPNATGVDLHGAYLAQRFTGRSAANGLQHLTVGDVFTNRNVRRLFSQNDINVLDQARRHGVISDAFALSSSTNFGLFRDTRTGRILDTQAFSPLRMFDAAHKALRTLNIPFTNWKPADLVFGAIRPMIAEGRHTTIGSNQIMPDGVTRTGRGLNFSMGGTVFSQVPGMNRFSAIAHDVKVYDISGEGSHFYGRAVAIKNGAIQRGMERGLQNRTAATGMSWWQRIQQLAGVGPEYATNRSVLGMTLDASERHSIDQGRRTGTFLRNPYVPREATLSSLERARAQAAFDQGRLHARYSSFDDYLNEAIPLPSNISAVERLKAKVGNSRTGAHYRVPPGPGFPGDKIGDVANSRTPSQGYTPASRTGVRVAGPGGVIATHVPATGAVDSPGFLNTFNLFMHHATERLNQLIGTTTGFGVRPSRGSLGWIGTLGKIYGGAMAAKTGLEYLKYADFVAGEALDFVPGLDNTTPSEYAVKGYAGAMVARQKFREAIGLQQMAAYSEGLMPGSMSLPGMVALRTVGPVAVGAAMRGSIGAAAGGLISLVIGGVDPGMPAQELQDIYSGKKKEAVMKNRGWMMGLQPYGGNEIDYYRHNWVARYLANARYTDVQYGSKSEYFTYESSALTPHNLFGVMKIANPDHYADKHYYNRPYPYSTSGKRMHEGEEVLPSVDPASYNAQALGYEPSPGTYNLGLNPNSNNGFMRRGVDQVTQLGGIYKFLAQQMPFYNDLFGEGKGPEMYAAQAGTITSGTREFFDESVGGLLGMTELLRRFMSPDGGKQGINYIPNTMPDWLPGARSSFANDRDYFTDYTLGDPYAKIPMGEMRLPGAGYEALARLHSGTPGVYDAFDRYKILADVAPYSEAFKNYRTIVEAWAKSGALDKSSMEEYAQTEEQVRSVLDGPEFTPRIFSGVKSGTPEQLAAVNKYSIPERAIGAAWEHLTHDFVPAIGRAVPVFGTMFDRKLFGQRSAYESFLEDQVYGTDFHDWRKPIDTMIAPRIMNLAASDPLTATVGGASLGMLFGATPMGIAAGFVGGAALGTHSAGRYIAGSPRGSWTPSSYDERNKLEAYFDSLEYERAKTNEEKAKALGLTSLANEYGFQARRTSVGTNYDADDLAFMNAAKFRLGSPMRKYAWQFLTAGPESRAEIMKVAPEMAQPILASAWARQGDRRFSRAPAGTDDERAQNTIDYYGMPGNDWQGWSPDVPMKAVKIRTLDSYHNEAYDMHKYNLWEADRRMTNRNHPGLGSAF